jgi:predicted  nucleic acid-binding Zn-ribbon protein
VLAATHEQQHKRNVDKVAASDALVLLDEHEVSSAESNLATAVAQAVEAQSEVDTLKQQLAERDNTISSLSQQLRSDRDAHMRSAKAAEVDSKLRDKTEHIKRELHTLRKRDAEHEAALQQCRDAAAAAVAAATAVTTQLTAATAQLDEHEERSTCVVCQCEAKTVLLQPCLHLCLCVKCSTSPKLKDCPLCRAAIDYKETVHMC